MPSPENARPAQSLPAGTAGAQDRLPLLTPTVGAHCRFDLGPPVRYSQCGSAPGRGKAALRIVIAKGIAQLADPI